MLGIDRERGEVSAPRERDDETEAQRQAAVARRRPHRVLRCHRRAHRRVRQGLPITRPIYTAASCSIFTARRCASAVYAVVVCPSVRPSYAGIVSKRLDESSCFFAMEASFHLSHTVFYRNMGISKIRYFSLGLCSQTQHLENFATASRSRYQRNSLSPSSTVEFVDDTYRTIDESINCNPLTPLVAICCGFLVQLVSTADKILTDIQRVARSVCGSRVS